MIGYAMVSETGGQTTLATGDRMAELETLSVADGERGQGVGRALMDAAYAVMRELGVTEVMLYVLEGNDERGPLLRAARPAALPPRHARARPERVTAEELPELGHQLVRATCGPCRRSSRSAARD